METKELEKKLMKSLEEAWEIYKEYNPKGKVLSLSAIEHPDSTSFMIFNGRKEEEKVDFFKQKKNA